MDSIKKAKLDKKIRLEGDFKVFLSNGYPCVILRVEHSGHLCGYVGIPEGDKARNLPDAMDWDTDETIEIVFGHHAHGGITYDETSIFGICDSVFGSRRWVGFDCSHLHDFCPRNDRYSQSGSYKDMEYVIDSLMAMTADLVSYNTREVSK